MLPSATSGTLTESGYLEDVDQLVDNGGAVIKQALALAPGIYIVIAGSPCQDLTTIGRLKGALGLAGTRSIYFYTFHLTLHYLQEALTPSKVLYVLENAASMKAEYRQTIQLVLGNSGRTPQLRERDSGNHTAAQRKRYYFTNSTHTAEPAQDPTPWEEPWTAIEQLTHNAKHRLLPIVRLQGHDPHRGLYRHSHLALHPYSLLYHTATLPPDYLGECASSNQLLQHAFWRRHLPECAANTYCKYLALELKHTRNKQEDIELDKCTEELSFLFQNPCMHLPVRPLHYEEALTATVKTRPHPLSHTTPMPVPGGQLVPPQAYHGHTRNRGAQHEPSTDSSQVLPPMQVQEHFATKILAPLIENPNTKKQLQEMWKTNEERLRTLNPYRHLKLPPRSTGQQPPQPPQDVTPIQYGQIANLYLESLRLTYWTISSPPTVTTSSTHYELPDSTTQTKLASSRSSLETTSSP